MSISYGASQTAAVILTEDEAIKLAAEYASRFDPNPEDIVDPQDPGYKEYWSECLCGWTTVLDEDSCSSFDVIPEPGFEECGKLVDGVDPFCGPLYLVEACKQPSLFAAAYKDADGIVDEMVGDKDGLLFGQDREFVKDRLAFVSYVWCC